MTWMTGGADPFRFCFVSGCSGGGAHQIPKHDVTGTFPLWSLGPDLLQTTLHWSRKTQRIDKRTRRNDLDITRAVLPSTGQTWTSGNQYVYQICCYFEQLEHLYLYTELFIWQWRWQKTPQGLMMGCVTSRLPEVFRFKACELWNGLNETAKLVVSDSLLLDCSLDLFRSFCSDGYVEA